MSFSDIFKKSFLQGYANGSIDTKTICICIGISTLLAMYIFLVYKLITRKTFYDKSFNISLIGMAIITSAIILTIQSNIVLSLGMVGALSIVRFRTAIKDPLDLVFLYWAISVGIICGAGLAEISVILSIVVTIIVFIIQRYPSKKLSMLLVVNSNDLSSDKEIIEIVKQYCKYYKLKTKNCTTTSLNLILEVKIDKESELVNKVNEVEGVTSVSLVSHDGEVTV